MACYPLGYVGLLVAPHDLAVPAALLVGIGAATFPLILTLIGLRARTPAGTAALSGFTQSLGLPDRGARAVRDRLDLRATGGWTARGLLLALTLPQIAPRADAARPAYVEDQFHSAASRT